MIRRKWRWGNVPVPEVYVAVLAAGVVAHLALPARIFGAGWVGPAAGWPVLATAVALAAWAVLSAGDVRVDRPSGLLDSGAYRFSRNPMYLAWTLIVLGIGLVINSGWVVGLLPVAVLFTHSVTIPGEERYLESRFGEEYRRYRSRVRRWV